MSRIKSRILSLVFGVAACLALAAPANAQAVRTWIGGDNDWAEGAGNNANWNPADEPDSNEEAVFNTADFVELTEKNAVAALTLSGGIDLDMRGNDLTVGGLVQLSGAGTYLVVGSNALLAADNFTINNRGNIEVNFGVVRMDEAGGAGLFDIKAGGVLFGRGSIELNDALAGVTTLLVNDGHIQANGRVIILGPPLAGTLQINAADADARVDLDGAAESGVVSVSRNQTLDVNVRLADGFSGDINLGHNSTLDVSTAWQLLGGTIDVNNGFVNNTFPVPDAPADKAFIAGSTLSLAAGAITVLDMDGTLQFDAEFDMNGGSLVNNGHVIFNADANIGVGGNFTMPTNASSLTVAAGANVNIDQANFDADGLGATTNVLTVESGGVLDIDWGAGASDTIGGPIKLNGGELDVTTADNTWSISSFVDVGANSGASQINGETLAFFFAAVTVGENSQLDVGAVSSWGETSLEVEAGAVARLSATTFLGVTQFSGDGALRLDSSSVVAANTMIETATFDWDGATAGSNHTINNGVEFTIESPTFDDDGAMDDNVAVGNDGASLIVNSGPQWEMRGTLTTNSGDVGVTTVGGSSRMVLSSATGIWNVNGDTQADAKVTFDAGSTTNISAGAVLRLQGADPGSPNIISGGAISGAGQLAANASRHLEGSGTINASINFNSNADIIASGGLLDLNGAITHIGALRIKNGAELHLPVGFMTNVTDEGVILEGGALGGPTVTVAVPTRPIRGEGFVAADVNNNGSIEAVGGLLTLNSGATDFDGTTNTGWLRAFDGGTLQLNGGPAFNFAGVVHAAQGSTVRSNNFNFHFAPGSTLSLTASTFEATNSTDIHGQVNIGAGDSTIEIQVNRFLDFEATSTTMLTGNLTLASNNAEIRAGATFSGAGALIVPDGSHLVAHPNAEIGVLLDMQGAFRPANSEGVSRVDIKDYQQADTGELFVELRGTGLNQFDRLVIDGDAILDGYLNIDIDPVSPGVPFVPVLGNTFNIISANTLSGQFDNVDVSGMPAGLTFHLNYLPSAVQLQVVSTPLFSADFDNDGDVDATDLQIWDGAFALNQLGDADGDNDSDGGDFLLWQQQVGSAPATPAATAVPEPGAGGLAMLALGLAGAFRRIARRGAVVYT